MSILLEGVSAPASCYECISHNYYAFVNCVRFLEMGDSIKKHKHVDCPLKELGKIEEEKEKV